MTHDPNEPFPGSILEGRFKAIDWILENKGPVHIRMCTACNMRFYSPKLQAEVCHGCWYDSYMESIAVNYGDVLDALHAVEIPATVTQTGGMCLAITWPWKEGYFLLTDLEDVLSPEQDPAHGWTLGLYGGEDLDVVYLGDDEYLQDDVKNPTTAVALALKGLELASKQRTN